MKKFLSVIFALAMLIAPVGVTSCFAYGSSQEFIKSLAELVVEQDCESVKIIATMFADGTLDVGIIFLGKDGRYLKSIDAHRKDYNFFAKSFKDLGSLYKMQIYGLYMAQIIYQYHIKGDSSINIFYMDAKGNFKRV